MEGGRDQSRCLLDTQEEGNDEWGKAAGGGIVGVRGEEEEGRQTSLMRKCQMNKGRQRGLHQHEVQTLTENTNKDTAQHLNEE